MSDPKPHPKANARSDGKTPNSNPRPVNFFRPESPHARANSQLVAVSVILWAVLVFGFQILLIALNKPTPEPTLGQFEEVWSAVKSDSATADQQKQFAKTILMVLGKNIAVSDKHKAVLKSALSTSAKNLSGPELNLWTEYSAVYESLKGHKVGSDDIPDAVLQPLYEKRKELVGRISVRLGLTDTPGAATGFNSLMADLLPYSLVSVPEGDGATAWKDELPPIMKLYLTHNRSALTDTKFLGFPFHYWYTAQFLLIMFVIICIVYGVLIDRINRKYEFVEDREPATETK